MAEEIYTQGEARYCSYSDGKVLCQSRKRCEIEFPEEVCSQFKHLIIEKGVEAIAKSAFM